MKTDSKKHLPIRRPRATGAVQSPARTHSTAPTRTAATRTAPQNRTDSENAELPEGPRRQRRALSHVGGEVYFKGGSPEEQAVLLRALDVSADEDEVMIDVHGFHSYPARLHPATARGLIEGLSKKGDRVLDPFCGSGTVVVEAKALDRHAVGSDLNPLAVELAWLKSRAPTQKLVEEMLNAASHIAEVAEDRRVAKAEPYLRYGEEDRERYPIHILLELDSLAHGIGLVKKTEVERMLRLVVSSTLTKLSHSEGDTTRQKTPRRLPGGFAIQIFEQKAQELAERLAAYRSRVSERSPKAYVGCSDARDLAKIEDESVDLIITSPPYPGVYDYLDHHMHRIRWLGLHEGALRTGEIGARREYRFMRAEEAKDRWQEEIGATLYELRRTLTPDGRGVMVVADSVVDRKALRADEELAAVAKRAGIDITCIASQERPLFLHGAEHVFKDKPRMEHVVIFRPSERQHRKDRVDRAIDKEIATLKDRERPARFKNVKRDDAPKTRSYEPSFPKRQFQPAERNQIPSARGPEREDLAQRGFRDTTFRERDQTRSSDSRPAPGGGTERTQRANQDRTWDSRPSGPGRPRSKFGSKPK